MFCEHCHSDIEKNIILTCFSFSSQSHLARTSSWQKCNFPSYSPLTRTSAPSSWKLLGSRSRTSALTSSRGCQRFASLQYSESILENHHRGNVNGEPRPRISSDIIRFIIIFSQKLPSVSAHQPKPKVTPSHFYFALRFFCTKVVRPPDATFNTIIFIQCHFHDCILQYKSYHYLHLGGEAAGCDLWHNNAGLSQIWEGPSQGLDWW